MRRVWLRKKDHGWEVVCADVARTFSALEEAAVDAILLQESERADVIELGEGVPEHAIELGRQLLELRQPGKQRVSGPQ